MASNKMAYLGLAHRAGKTMVGSAACEKGIKRGKVRLLLLQSGLSDGSKASFHKLCKKHNIAALNTAEPIGAAIGRADVMVIGITDQGFATTIRNIVESDKGSGGV